MLVRPSSEEYATYYETYISLVPEGAVTDILAEQLEETTEFIAGLSEELANYRYAEGKWTVKEVIGHINDTERIMNYRLLRIARGDQTPLAGYDDEAYVAQASFSTLPFSLLLEDYAAVRRSTLTLLRGLPQEAWSREGVANNSKLTARALAYIIAGHELHHIRVIKERYLQS
jgi:hypothetical protein